SRTCELYVLRGEQNASSFYPIGNNASDQRKEKDRNPAQKLIQCKQESGMAEPIDEPALGDDLHPGANAGNAGPKPHQPEVTVGKCFEYPRQDRRLSGYGRPRCINFGRQGSVSLDSLHFDAYSREA